MAQKDCIIHYYDDEEYIYLWFEDVEYPELKIELSKLKGRISSMKWLRNEKCWQIPKINLQVIALFAYERFGPNTLIPTRKPSRHMQMELPFYE